MAAGWSRSSTEGDCREDGAEEGGDSAPGFEDQSRSPPSQKAAWSSAASGLEDEGGLIAGRLTDDDIVTIHLFALLLGTRMTQRWARETPPGSKHARP